MVLNPGIYPLSEVLRVLEVLFIDFFQFKSAIDSYLTISPQIKIHCVITTSAHVPSFSGVMVTTKNRLLKWMNLLSRYHCTSNKNLFNSIWQ